MNDCCKRTRCVLLSLYLEQECEGGDVALQDFSPKELSSLDIAPSVVEAKNAAYHLSRIVVNLEKNVTNEFLMIQQTASLKWTDIFYFDINQK